MKNSSGLSEIFLRSGKHKLTQVNTPTHKKNKMSKKEQIKKTKVWLEIGNLIIITDKIHQKDIKNYKYNIEQRSLKQKTAIYK